MAYQRIKYLKLGVCLSFLTLSSYCLETYLQPIAVQAQPATSSKAEADRLLQAAEQLRSNETQFIEAWTKYKQALKIYRQIGDDAGANITRQKLESALAVSLPLASRQEQEIERDTAKFLSQFPATENNQTANKLQELAGKMGFKLRTDNVTRADEKYFEEIQKELQIYLDEQLRNPTNKVAAIPEKLRDYLNKNAGVLKEIRALILNNEMPRWKRNLDWIPQGDAEAQLPNYAGFVHLQRLLALDILDKQQQGQTKELEATLETSWKIGESLQDDPLLLAQLIGIINTRIQAGVIRKLDGLPSEWQQRLLAWDRRQSVLQSLTGENLFGSAVKRKYNQQNFAEIGDDYLPELGWRGWSQEMRQNFLRWEAIAAYQHAKRIHETLPADDACSFDFKSWQSTVNPDYREIVDRTPLILQWAKGGQIMVELELTQKILQIKEIAAKQGSFPRELSNIKSAICPGSKWVYQRFINDKISISLQPMPKWISDGSSRSLPLTYSIQP